MAGQTRAPCCPPLLKHRKILTFRNRCSLEQYQITPGQSIDKQAHPYRGRHDQSHPTSEHEILPIIQALAGLKMTSEPVAGFGGHPLVTDPAACRWWFLALPMLFLLSGGWFRCRIDLTKGDNPR
jgi:hypothetical protein